MCNAQVAYNLRFPGQYFDAETGYNYNYYRDFDPSVGRYVQSDPAGLAGGINSYTYVAGHPLTERDSKGLIGEKDPPPPPPQPIDFKCPMVEGWNHVDQQFGVAPITACFPVFNPQTRRAEMVCMGNGNPIPPNGDRTDKGWFGWTCVVECIYRRTCDNKEMRREGTCLRGPKGTNS